MNNGITSIADINTHVTNKLIPG